MPSYDEYSVDAPLASDQQLFGSGSDSELDESGRRILNRTPPPGAIPRHHKDTRRKKWRKKVDRQTAKAQQRKEATVRRGVGVGATILGALLARGAYNWANYDPDIVELNANENIVQELPKQIEAIEDVIENTKKCQEGGVYGPGIFTGNLWRRETTTQTCWVPVYDDFKDLLKLSLGNENVNSILTKYNEANIYNFPKASIPESSITIEQANELLDMLTIRAINSQVWIKDYTEEMEKTRKDATAITPWKKALRQLPPPNSAEFDNLLDEARQMNAHPSARAAARAVIEGTYGSTGGTRRKRHRRRKTKKHRKSKQKKSTRRVRRKHKKRQTRRKS